MSLPTKACGCVRGVCSFARCHVMARAPRRIVGSAAVFEQIAAIDLDLQAGTRLDYCDAVMVCRCRLCRCQSGE
jgi:hypothetical protein